MAAIIGYNNLLDTGTVTASTEATGFEKENAYDNNTYDYWKPTAVPAYLNVDMGVDTACDYLFIAAHDMGDTGGTIQLQYADDASYATNLTDVFTTTDSRITEASDTRITEAGDFRITESGISFSSNKPIFKTFTSVSKRYWRIKLDGVISSLGFVKFGVRLDLPAGMRPGFDLITESRNHKLVNQISEGGEFLNRSVIREGGKGKITLTLLTPAWIRSNWESLADAIELAPFAFQWDNTNYPGEAALCWTRNMPTPKYTHPTFMSVSIDVDTQVR